MSLWGRIKSFVNEHILATQEQTPPEPEPFYSEPPPYIPPPSEDYGDSSQVMSITDDWDIYRGTQTYDQWYQDTLLNTDQFQAKYGPDFHQLELIELIGDYYGIYDWDWDRWREDYAGANGE